MRITLCVVGLGLLFACGGMPYTWRGASQELAEIYCEGLERCGSVVNVDRCIEHQVWHLCEPQHTCEVPVDEGAISPILAECEAAVRGLNENGCFLLGFVGYMPEPCEKVFEFEP